MDRLVFISGFWNVACAAAWRDKEQAARLVWTAFIWTTLDLCCSVKQDYSVNGPPGGEPGDLWISSQPQASAAGVHRMCSAVSCGYRLDTAERKRSRSVCVCDDNGDCKGGLRIGECVCVCIRWNIRMNQLGGEGGLYWLSGGRSVVLYISKAPAYVPSPLSTSHGVWVCVFLLPVSQVLTYSCQQSWSEAPRGIAAHHSITRASTEDNSIDVRKNLRSIKPRHLTLFRNEIFFHQTCWCWSLCCSCLYAFHDM